MEKIIILTLLIFQGMVSICQVKKTNYPNRVQIDVILDGKMNKDSLYIGYYANYWGPDMGMEINEANRNKRNNSFYFDIRNGDRGAYFYIYKLNSKGIKLRVLPFFLCEKGDVVKIYIAGDSTKFSGTKITFTGRQAAKYQCQYEISNAKPKNVIRSYNYTIRNGDIIVDSVYYSYLPDMLEKKLIHSKITSEMGLAVLEKYKSLLSPFIYNLLKVDILSKEETSNYNSFNYSFGIFSGYPLPKIRKQIEPKLREIYSRRHLVKFQRLQNEYLPLSRLYINAMVKKIVDTLINPNDNYPEFKKSYMGLARDRIVTAYLKRYYAFKPGLGDQLSDALTYVKTGYCRKILASFSTLVPGIPAFKFSLPDSSNSFRELSEFKGKVMIMDFWFTGCIGCATLNERMKPISEYFKNNQKVAFVTISIDKDKKQWKNSIKSGKYTHAGSVDLHANGSGYNSPIIEHYNIIGCPTLILIDPDGKIITGNPPTPPKNKELIALIEKHIH